MFNQLQENAHFEWLLNKHHNILMNNAFRDQIIYGEENIQRFLLITMTGGMGIP